MTTTTRENLVGYLLGALEADEQAQVELELERSPQLQRELETIRARVEPLSWLEDDVAPPPGLASQTCDQIFSTSVRTRLPFPPIPDQHTPLRSAAESAEAVSPAPSQPRPASRLRADEPASPSQGWSSSDIVVLAGLCVAMLVMLGPALHSNVELARRNLCQNNLRTIGASLSEFAGLNPDRSLPTIEPSGPFGFAGMVVPILRDRHLLPRPAVLVCPSDDVELQLYSLEELNAANDAKLGRARQDSLGSMGYNLGVVVDGEYQAPRHQGRRHYALMAEMPSSDRSSNHGHGRNVLFEDEHVEYVLDNHHTGDDPFRNRRGLVKAGIGVNDAVIGASHVSPLGNDVHTVGHTQ